MKRFILVCLACLTVLGCAPRDPIRVGFVGGISGRFADLGGNGRNGALLAIEQRNRAGGINGHPIELLVRDDEQDADKIGAIVHELAGQKVAAIIGPMTSAMGVAILPSLRETGLIAVAGTATSSGLAGQDDNFFRVVSSTRVYARGNAKVAARRFGTGQAVALVDVANREYTENWLQEFSGSYAEEGGKIVSVVRFNSLETRNYKQLAEQALASRPAFVAIAANATDTALLSRKLRQDAPGIALVAGDWSSSERLLELGGEAVEGLQIDQYYNLGDRSERYLAFSRAFTQRFGGEPGIAAVAGYDATNVVMDALMQDAHPAHLKETLLRIRAFHGVQDDIRFDDAGDAIRQVYLAEVRHGRFEPVR